MKYRALLLFPLILVGLAWKPLPQADNVILLIPDGCSQSLATLSRLYAGAPLPLDAIQVGAVTTRSLDKSITDSAAAGSAYASGFKHANGSLSISPDGKPRRTIAEAAKAKGLSVGLVTTVNLSDATPAAFGSHVPSRKQQSEIALQILRQDFDVLMGGGASFFNPYKTNGFYSVWITNRTDLLALDAPKYIGLFAETEMALSIDRPTETSEPTLAEMTVAALKTLSKNKKGFFLMVEGGQVDRVMHANDGAAAVQEFLAFNQAVSEVLAFARRDGRTLVIACPDHDTGGLTLANAARKGYSTCEELVAPLSGMKCSAKTVCSGLSAKSGDIEIAAALLARWNITFSAQDRADLRALLDKGRPLVSAVLEIVNTRFTALSWSTNGHTGVDVPLWAFGPQAPAGVLDNTEVCRHISKVLELDLFGTPAAK